MENLRENEELKVVKEKVNINIDGIDYQLPQGLTILEAARMVNVEIPSLCYLKDINEIGACRVCVV